MFKVGDRVLWMGNGLRICGTVITEDTPVSSFSSYIFWDDGITANALNKNIKLIRKKKSKSPRIAYWK